MFTYKANKDLIRTLTELSYGILVLQAIYSCIKLSFLDENLFHSKKAFKAISDDHCYLTVHEIVVCDKLEIKHSFSALADADF